MRIPPPVLISCTWHFQKGPRYVSAVSIYNGKLIVLSPAYTVSSPKVNWPLDSLSEGQPVNSTTISWCNNPIFGVPLLQHSLTLGLPTHGKTKTAGSGPRNILFCPPHQGTCILITQNSSEQGFRRA